MLTSIYEEAATSIEAHRAGANERVHPQALIALRFHSKRLKKALTSVEDHGEDVDPHLIFI